MGVKTFGPPSGIILELAKRTGATAFVETGTYRGQTASWAAGHFERVWTIELAESLYEHYGKPLASLAGVTPILGNSRTVLPKVLEELKDRTAVFWLDGHWSGMGTAGEADECPLLDELGALTARNRDVILIDDARFVLSVPPRPHDPSQWPTMTEIINALQRIQPQPYVQVIDDVIFAVPDVPGVRDCLINYAQQHADEQWKQYVKDNNARVNRSLVDFVLSPLRCLFAAKSSGHEPIL